MEGVALGHIKKEQAGDDFREVSHDTHKRQLENIVLGPNPELFLNKYKNAQDLIKDFPMLTPGDYQDLNSGAIGQQRYNKARKSQIATEAIRRIKKLAADSNDPKNNPAVIKEKIRQSDALDETEKEELFDLYTKSLELWKDTGINSFEKTQNYSRFTQMKNDARDKKMTEEEIRKWEGHPDGISTIHADRVRSIMNKKDDASKTAQVIKSEGNIISTIKDFSLELTAEDVDLEPIPKEFKKFATEKALQQYNDWRDSQEGPIKPRDDDYMALRIARDMLNDLRSRKYKSLEEFFAKTPEAPLIEKTLGLESIWGELTNQEKRDAVAAKAQGKTSEEIIDYFNRNK